MSYWIDGQEVLQSVWFAQMEIILGEEDAPAGHAMRSLDGLMPSIEMQLPTTQDDEHDHRG